MGRTSGRRIFLFAVNLIAIFLLVATISAAESPRDMIAPRIIKLPSIGAEDQSDKIWIPPIVLPNTTLPESASKYRALPSIQAKDSGMAGKMRIVANTSTEDWREGRRITISNLLAINQTANLEFAEGSGPYINSEENYLNARFRWRPTIAATALALAPASAVWQVSMMPFPEDPNNWEGPPGLLAQGNLRIDELEFTLNFRQFTPTRSEIAHYWAKSQPHLLFQKNVLTSLKNAASAKLARIDPSNSRAIQACNDLLAETDNAIRRVDASPLMNTADLQRISRLPNLNVNANVMAADHTILRTKSISSDAIIGIQRGILGTAQTSGVSEGADTRDININNDIINSRLSLSKQSLLYTLPQTRRTYYIRVVLLDARGNCTGMPSNQKEVIIGKPVVEVVGDPKNMVKLAVAFTPSKPHWTQDMCNGYYVEADMSMDWNGDLNRWFVWKSNLTNLTDAEWQVSRVPFDGEDLVNTIRLEAGGKPSLNPVLANLTGSQQQVQQVSHVPSNVEDPMNPIGLVARGKLNLDPADLTKQGSCAGKGVHEFSIDFSKFAPAPDPNNPLKIKYYVRVIALSPHNSPGEFLGHLSPTRTIAYGQPEQQMIEASERVPVKVFQPDVKVLSYSQPRNSLNGWEYHYLATKDFPEIDCGFAKQGSFWHKGDRVDLTPEDESWWDEFVNFVGSIVDFFIGVINWISEAWDTIKSDCINAIAGTACFGDPGCTEALTPIVGGGLDAGLVAMGIPPDIPNFNKLATLGEDYLVKTIAAEAGASPELAGLITPDDIKRGVDVLLQESGSGGPVGLKPDPDWQEQPAYMVVQLSNSQSEPTMPGTLDISDSSMVFRPKLGSVPIPPLQPGESMTVPITFEVIPWCEPIYAGGVMYECCYHDADGNIKRGVDGEICYEDWLKLYGAPDRFTVTACCDPGIDVQALEEQLGKKYVGTCIFFGGAAETFYIQYLYEGQNSEVVEITPSQPWSACENNVLSAADR